MVSFLLRIWSFVKPYAFRLILGWFCGVAFALANGALVAVVRLAINIAFAGPTQISPGQQLVKNSGSLLRPFAERVAHWLPAFQTPSSKSAMVLIVCLIPAVMLIRGVLSYLNLYLTSWAAARSIGDLRAHLFNHLQNLPLSFFSRASTGDLISRVVNDTQVVYGIISNSLTTVIKDPVTILVLASYLIFREPILTIISLAVMPLCLAPVISYGRRVRKSAGAAQTHISDLVRLMHETFSANRIIKAYNLEEPVLKQFIHTTSKYVSQGMRVLRANEIPSQLMEFLGALGVALMLVYAILSTSNNQPRLQTGDFLSFALSIFLMYQPFKNLLRLHNQLHQAKSASEKVFELLDTGNEVVDPPAPKPLRAEGAAIEFADVDFDYGDRPILRGINLTIEPGDFIGVVGGSGSGKTTLTNLLLRFYDPRRGSVRIGGTDIREVGIKELRRQIALVAQETILFNETIRYNIALARPGATDAEVEAAARNAYAHDFIMQTALGYDTIVGEKGISLSGGQRKRIMLARALLKDAPILVLDEALSELDAETERDVQERLEKVMAGRTFICIAHRLSTIQKADMIVVFENGRIAEKGTHNELIKARGVYRRLYELQSEPVREEASSPGVVVSGVT